MGPHEGMYRGAIASEKNDPQFTRTEDPSIAAQATQHTNDREPINTPSRVHGYRYALTKLRQNENQYFRLTLSGTLGYPSA